MHMFKIHVDRNLSLTTQGKIYIGFAESWAYTQYGGSLKLRVWGHRPPKATDFCELSQPRIRASLIGHCIIASYSCFCVSC